MMKSESGAAPQATRTLQSQLSSSKSGGQVLPSATNSFMSNAFGADFSHVRIHHDSKAQQMSQGIRARAFTHGNHIYFNRGEYSPNSARGKRLLGHELTHVVQQSGESSKVQRAAISDLDDDRIQRASIDPLNGPQFGNPLPYREATEMAACTRIMGEGSYEHCYQEVLGRHPNPYAALIAAEEARRTAALNASCSHDAGNLTWTDFTGTPPSNSAFSALTSFRTAPHTAAGQAVIRAEFRPSHSWVKAMFANPTNRSLNGCAGNITNCQQFYDTLPPNSIVSQHPSLGAALGNCSASISADTSLVARNRGECESVLGTECDRAATAESNRLLRHEQYHYALACALARKGTEAILNGIASAHVFTVTSGHITRESTRYDNETHHGCDQAAQSRWEGVIDAGFPGITITPPAAATP